VGSLKSNGWVPLIQKIWFTRFVTCKTCWLKFRIRRTNMDLNFRWTMMRRTSIWWIQVRLRTICPLESRRGFRIGLRLRLKGVGRIDWLSTHRNRNCKPTRWILQIVAGVNLSKFLFWSRIKVFQSWQINKYHLSVESLSLLFALDVMLGLYFNIILATEWTLYCWIRACYWLTSPRMRILHLLRS